LRLIPGPLLAVAWGICYNSFAVHLMPEWVIGEKHLVSLPVLGNAASFIDQLRLPDFNQFSNPKAYGVAVTIAIIASLESLLSIEAVDKLDPQKRIAPANRELKAQGIGNFISGLVGGLPITAVIVRSSANINAGGKTRLACFFHGVLLLISVLFFSTSLNTIPLACLAAILLHTGYKLASPRLFVAFYQRGWNQFLPFLITVLAILLADLLAGIAIGMLFGFFFVLKANFHAAITLTQHGSNYLLRLHKDVSFLNKALLRKYLQDVPENSDLWIDGSKAQFIDDDILDAIADFMLTALNRNINVELQDIAMPVRSNISH
jgi:MFS superfamily sulfate permease-like transporter